MPSFKGLGKFFGNTASTAAGFAAGVATAPALVPALQAIENEAWSLHPDKPPDAATLAEGVSQGQVPKAQAYKWAAETGYSSAAMDALVNIANGGPGVGQAFRLWRRGEIDDAGFARAAKREGLEEEWITALLKTKSEPLDPADLARAIHKGLIPDPGLLATPAPSGTGKVPAYPVYPIDALAAALAAGYTRDELGALVGLQGNPMGAHEAAQATFRGVLEPVDYERAIAEGNTRNEWGPAIFEQSRAIPSPTNYVEGFVRNWITRDAMHAGAARHGMTADDTELLFLIHGRPLTQHQVFIGLRRGGAYDGPTDQIPQPILKAMQEGNLRPEWYNLAAAALETLPGIMIIRQWLKDGGDTQVAHEWLYKEGYNETDIGRIITQYAPKAAGAAPKPKPLTNATIRSLLRKGDLTQADALARLEGNGLSATDAQLYLDA